MATASMDRRRFLLSTVALGAAGTIAGASRSLALSTEPMDAQTEAIYLSACQAPGSINPYHRQLLDNLMAVLRGKPQAELEARLSAATCPICGCGIAS